MSMRREAVVVVGAGVFGAWSALKLAREGWQVTLVDAYGAANGRASSSDHSRVIRAGYGALEDYSRWATASLVDWQWLSATVKEPLVVETGVLFFGAEGSRYVEDTAGTLGRLGLAHERLDGVGVAMRYPQIDAAGVSEVLYEPQGGVIRARHAVAATVALAQQSGVTYRREWVARPDESAERLTIRLAHGETLAADQVVFACGPWLPSLFPGAIGDRIRPTRQEVLYFGVPPGERRFGLRELPAWIDFPSGLYGIPDLDAYGFKVGLDRHGPPIDPDTADRVVGHDVVAAVRAFLARRFPALAAAPLVDARVCQYENTSTGDFIIDTHPSWDNVWLVGGGSGHGFKHGPAVGAHVADLLAGRTRVLERFALAGKSTEPARAVF